MQRFFLPSLTVPDMHISDPGLLHQITRVLRIQTGEHIILFDGDGSEWDYEVLAIERKSVHLQVWHQYFPDTEATKQIILCQALPNKYEKIEYILQKWVEVGISRFLFFRSERSQSLTITSTKYERFLAVAREALEQCGGVVFPEIAFIDAWPEDVDMGSSIVLDTMWEHVTCSIYTHLQRIFLWVWPEGGWSEAERIKMVEKGFIFACFWNRILRTETAGVVVSFGLLYGG